MLFSQVFIVVLLENFGGTATIDLNNNNRHINQLRRQQVRRMIKFKVYIRITVC